METVTAKQNVDISTELGKIKIYGKTSTKEGDISLAAAENTYVEGMGGRNFIIEQNGVVDSGRDVSLNGRNGDLHVTDRIQAVRNLNTAIREEGSIFFDRDVSIQSDANVQVENGNITIMDLTADGNVRLSTKNGDITMHDVVVGGDADISSTESGSINGNNVTAAGTTHVALANGDLYLNLAEGKVVVLKMENNTENSRVENVRADANGEADPDVLLTGNYINIGTLASKGGDSVFEVTAMGAGGQKLIDGDLHIDSLRSESGTHMPYLWTNTGSVRVDEGDFTVDDLLAVDKVHLVNAFTDLAIFGRTPTRDGEQLVYWNNLGRAYDKERFFKLYANGKVRTSKAVLIDAGKHYDKLYGDNLSVVDMMRERLTREHGQYTFDRTWYTKPGEDLRERILFGLDVVDDAIRQQNTSDREFVVE